MRAISEVIQLASCYNSCVAAEQLLGNKITNEMLQFKIARDVLFREESWHVADIDQSKHGMHNILDNRESR